MKILLIEDESRLARNLATGLREEGFAVQIAVDGDDGLFQAQTGEHDVIILDVMLPGRNGFDVLRTLRAGGSRARVLMLTAQRRSNPHFRHIPGTADPTALSTPAR